MSLDVIFISPDMPRIGPVISVDWDGPEIELVRSVREYISGGLPEDASADFIGGLYKEARCRVEVKNLVYPREWYENENKDRFEWFRRVMEWIQTVSPPPLLINLDPPFHISRGDRVLGKFYMDRRPVLGEP